MLLLLGLVVAINTAFANAGLHLFLGRHQINQCLWNACAAAPAGGVGMRAAGVVLAAEWAFVFVDCVHGEFAY